MTTGNKNSPVALREIIFQVKEALGLDIEFIDSEPHSPTGIWYVDFRVKGTTEYVAVVQWQEGAPIGVSDMTTADFTAKADKYFTVQAEAVAKTVDVILSRTKFPDNMNLVPIYRPEASDKFAFQFSTPVVLAEGLEAPSGAIKFGVPVDILGLSTVPALIESGLQDYTDCIDQRNFVIEKVYYSESENASLHQELSAEDFPPLRLRREEGISQHILRGGYEMKMPGVNGHAGKPIQFHASLDLQTGRLLVTHSECKTMFLRGYKVSGQRYNPNRRPTVSVPAVVRATLDDIVAGATVYTDRHAQHAIVVRKIGVEAKTAESDPRHNWVVINDHHFYKVDNSEFVEGLWLTKPQS
jgi:hypothetical protein